MAESHRPRLAALLGLFLAAVALLAMGALKARQDYLTRGIPAGLPQPVAHSGTRWGINVNLGQYDEAALADNLSRLKQTGFRYVKQPFYLSQPFDWQESDRLVAAVAEHDLILVPLLDGNPADDFAPPADPAVFAEWAGQFASRYGDHVRHYIIWDEPNLTSHWGNQPVNAAEYAALLTAAAQTIRSADADAVIVAAPLAPTAETGPANLTDPLYLQQLYDVGAADAFDVAAGKPYGFDSGPEDRTVALDKFNFSRAILLREVMAQNGDGHKALWAGNWGWNSLPANWSGDPSVWGQVSAEQQAAWTVAAFQRARREWPWMGIMFLENWEPETATDDPRWGFSIAGRATAAEIQSRQSVANGQIAYPGFHLAQAAAPAQVYEGGWRFSPEFGADISESGDRATFTFWGTDVGLRVRQANFRARLYLTVDGQTANALPQDENGSALVLTAADEGQDVVVTEWVARDLAPGEHTLTAVAARGWDQWALNGFSVAYHPPDDTYVWGQTGLALVAILSLLVAIRTGRRAQWGAFGRSLSRAYGRLSYRRQVATTVAVAALVTLTGWLTWGEQAAGLYRRLGDNSQLALTAAAASLFYVAPAFVVYVVALLILFLLLYFRPVWGLVLVAFCFPFYVEPVLKPIFHYRFSPVEIFTLVAFAAFVLSRLTHYLSTLHAPRPTLPTPRSTLHALHHADYAVLAFTAVATLSLLFTERLDVASNEWRMVILEPALFYFLLRGINPGEREMWTILDAFVVGGLAVALYGLWQYGFRPEELITAEGGLLRLRSIYGSPNNVALYLGRILPLLAAMALIGRQRHGWRRWAYTAALLPLSLAVLLTFSKGGLFVGLPAAFLFVVWRWQKAAGRRSWPWLIGLVVLGLLGISLTQQIPALAGRLDLRGATGDFRINLWRASLNMFADHPLFGVGLDNFLYAYRGRYIFESAWQEPNLSHPHNIVLDFATRLGLLGLLAGGWMLWVLAGTLWAEQKHLAKSEDRFSTAWRPVAAGLGGAFVAMLAHGLVDHSFFLVDLAFTFYLMLGTVVWLQNRRQQARRISGKLSQERPKA